MEEYQEEYQLESPIILDNGNILRTLKFDFSSLKMTDFKAAQRLRKQLSDTNSVDPQKLLASFRLDNEFQIAVAFLAAVKGTPNLSQSDFMKLAFKDLLMIGEKASDYFFL